jgi:ribosome-associated protein
VLTRRTSVPDAALTVKFVRAGGPGGQNVNKVATAVELRLDLGAAELPAALLARLEDIARNRINQAGELVLFAQRFRTQERNRADALARLGALVAEAEVPPKPRVPTRPTKASKVRRRDAKGRRGVDKRLRRKPELE